MAPSRPSDADSTLDPTNPLAHVHYSWLLSLLGREDAALAEAQRGQALAPSSRLVAGARAQTLYVAGRYDEAIDVCSDCLRVDQGYVFAVHVRGLCYLARSMRDEAVADLEQAASLSRRTPFYLAILGRCYGEFGMRAEALGLVAELSRQPPDTYVPPQAYVFIYAGPRRARAGAAVPGEGLRRRRVALQLPVAVHPRAVCAVSAPQATPGADATGALTAAPQSGRRPARNHEPRGRFPPILNMFK